MTSSCAASVPQIRRLGCVAYGEALTLQQRLRDALLEGAGEETVLLLEHPDTITFGRAARAGTARLSDADLQAAGYDIHRVNRGGDVTYHGPGQLVGYPILDLSRRGSDVHVYLRQLEGVLIEVLADFGLCGIRREGYAGVWLDDRHKIASIGVGLRRWVTSHGFALNVCCDLERFDVIIPCGLEDVRMASMRGVLERDVDLAAVTDQVEAQLRKAFP